MRVRITLNTIGSTYEREVDIEEAGHPETRELLVARTTDNPIVADVYDDRTAILTVWTLEKGQRVVGTNTPYTFVPKAPIAAEAALPAVETIAVEQKDTALVVTPVTTPRATLEVAVPEPKKKAVSGFETGSKDTVPADREVEIEVRVSETSVTNPADAVEAAVVTVPQSEIESVQIAAPPVPDAEEVKVWTRLTNPETREIGEWASRNVLLRDPAEYQMQEHFTDAWGTAIIEDILGMPSMVAVGSELAVATPPSPFASPGNGGYPNSPFASGGPSPFSIAKVFPYGRFKTPEVDTGVKHEFFPQFWPDVDDHARAAQPSPFSSRRNPFLFRRPDEGPFLTQPDIAPVRVRHEIQTAADDVEPLRDPEPATPGKRFIGRRIQTQHTVLACLGSRRAPKIRRLYWRRRVLNRKWEWGEPFDPPAPGTPMTVALPSVIRATIGLPIVTVTIEDTAGPINGVGFDVHTGTVAGSPGAYTIPVLVVQRTSGVEPAAAGAWGPHAFPKTFAAPPVVAFGTNDPVNASFSGFNGALTAAAIAGGYIAFPAPGGGAGAGAGAVEILAEGFPIPSSLGGTVVLRLTAFWS